MDEIEAAISMYKYYTKFGSLGQVTTEINVIFGTPLLAYMTINEGAMS